MVLPGTDIWVGFNGIFLHFSKCFLDYNLCKAFVPTACDLQLIVFSLLILLILTLTL